MDFFEAQEQAQKRTKWLVLWFALAVIAVVAAVDFLFYLFLGQKMGRDLVRFRVALQALEHKWTVRALLPR